MVAKRMRTMQLLTSLSHRHRPTPSHPHVVFVDVTSEISFINGGDSECGSDTEY